MSKAEFERWSRRAEIMRDKALGQYDTAKSEEEKAEIIEGLRIKLNREERL